MTVFSSNIPDGMVQLMKDLTKDILKERPENIYEYAAQYFENLLKKRDGSLDKGYGKFRSYEKYCKFIEQLQLKQLKQQQEKQKLKNRQSSTSDKSSNSGGSGGTNNNNNYETDSGVGSSNTDDETIKVGGGGGNPIGILKKLEVNGRAVPVGKRNNETITTTTTNTNNKSIIQRRRKVNQKSLGVAVGGGGGGDGSGGDTLAVVTQAAADVTATIATTTTTPTIAKGSSYDDDDDVGAVTNNMAESSVVVGDDDENNIESELFTEIENDNDSGELIDSGRPYCKSARPRKLSSQKPSENLIVIKEETSADVVAAGVTTTTTSAAGVDHLNQEVAEDDHELKITKAATVIQTAFRKFITNKTAVGNSSIADKIKMDENMAALVIQKCLKGFIIRKAYERKKTGELKNTEASTSKNDTTELNTNIEEKMNDETLSKNDLVNETPVVDLASQSNLSALEAKKVADTKIDEIEIDNSKISKEKLIEAISNTVVNENSTDHQSVDSISINNNEKTEDKLIETSENNAATEDQQSVQSIPNLSNTEAENEEKFQENSSGISENDQTVTANLNNKPDEAINDEKSKDKSLIISEKISNNENQPSNIDSSQNEIESADIDEKFDEKSSKILETMVDSKKYNENQQSLDDSTKNDDKSMEILENNSDNKKHNENLQSLGDSSKKETENTNYDEKSKSHIEDQQSADIISNNEMGNTKTDEKSNDKISEISENKATSENHDKDKGSAALITNNNDLETMENEKSEIKSSEILTDIVNSEKQSEDQGYVIDIPDNEVVDSKTDEKLEEKSSEILTEIVDSEKQGEDNESTNGISDNKVVDAKTDEKPIEKSSEIKADIVDSEKQSKDHGFSDEIPDNEVVDAKTDKKSEEISSEIVTNSDKHIEDNGSIVADSANEVADTQTDEKPEVKTSEILTDIDNSEKHSEDHVSIASISTNAVADAKNGDESDDKILDLSENNSTNESYNENHQTIATISSNEVADIKNDDKSEQESSEILGNIDTNEKNSEEQKSLIATSNNEIIDTKNDEKSNDKITEILENNSSNENLSGNPQSVAHISKNENDDIKNDEKSDEKITKTSEDIMNIEDFPEVTNNEEKLSATDVLDIKTIEKSEIKTPEPPINDHKSTSVISEINVTAKDQDKDQLSLLDNSTNETTDSEQSEKFSQNTDVPNIADDIPNKQDTVIEENTSNILSNDLNKIITENQGINEAISSTESKNHTRLEESISNFKPPIEEKTSELSLTNDQADGQQADDQQSIDVLARNDISNPKTNKNHNENISEVTKIDLEVTNLSNDQESSDNTTTVDKIKDIGSGIVNEIKNSEQPDLKVENDTGPTGTDVQNDLGLNEDNISDDNINKSDDIPTATVIEDQVMHENIPEITNEIKLDHSNEISNDKNEKTTDLTANNNANDDQDVPSDTKNINSDNKSTDVLSNEVQSNKGQKEEIKLSETVKNLENPKESNNDVNDKIKGDITEPPINQNLKDISESDAQLEKLIIKESGELSGDHLSSKEELIDTDDNKSEVVLPSDVSSIPKDVVPETTTENAISDKEPVITDTQDERLELINIDQTELQDLQSKMAPVENESIEDPDLNKKIIENKNLVTGDHKNDNDRDIKTKIDYPGCVNDKETGEFEENKIDITDPIAKQLLSYSIIDSKENNADGSSIVPDQNKETDIEKKSTNSETTEKQLPLDMLSSFEEVGLKLVPTEIIEHATLNDSPSILSEKEVNQAENIKKDDQLLQDHTDLKEKNSVENPSEDEFNKTYTIDSLATKELDKKGDNLDHTYTIHGENAKSEKHSDELNRTFIIEKETVDKNSTSDDQESSNAQGLKRTKRSLVNLNEISGETLLDHIDIDNGNKNNVSEIENDKEQISITETIIKADNSEPSKIDPLVDTAELPSVDGAKISTANIHEVKPTSSDDSCDSDNGITFEVKKSTDKFKESGIDETSRDELSEIENFDLSSCGEDSLEAMYYSLKKNELLLNKMQEQKDAKSTSSITVETVADENEDSGRKNFPQNITKTLGNAINQVMGSSNDNDDVVMGDGRLMSAESLTSPTADEPSSADEMFKEMDLYELNNSGNISYNKTSEKPKKAPKKSKTVSYFDANDYEDDDDDNDDDSSNGTMMTPMMATAMEQTSAFLHRIHGSIEEEKEDDDVDDDGEAYEQRKLKSNFSSYGSDERFDHFPDHDDDDGYDDRPSSYRHRNILAASISEADSDYFNPSATTAAARSGSGAAAVTTGGSASDDDELGRLGAAPLTKRLIKDDFNISTAFGHLTSTDSDSTINSAATKIQAGARGFLTRRRLRRSSNDTSTTTANDTFCSFGNAAIDKSLEDLVEQQEQIDLDEAAIKIQKSFRKYLLRKNDHQQAELASKSDSVGSGDLNNQQQQQSSASLSSSSGEGKPAFHSEYGGIIDVTLGQKKFQENANDLGDNSHSNKTTDEDSVDSVENDRRQISVINTADTNLGDTAQRRMTLQRGDAVQRNSTPDELSENNSSGDSVGNGGGGVGGNGFKPSAPPPDEVVDPLVTSTETAVAAGTITMTAVADNNNIDDDSSTTNETDEKKMNKVLSNTKSVGQQHKTDQEEVEVIKSTAVKSSMAQLAGGKNNFGNLLIRQKSMPVQIDMEFMRIVPKHLRKRIKSADSQKKKR